MRFVRDLRLCDFNRRNLQVVQKAVARRVDFLHFRGPEFHKLHSEHLDGTRHQPYPCFLQERFLQLLGQSFLVADLLQPGASSRDERRNHFGSVKENIQAAKLLQKQLHHDFIVLFASHHNERDLLFRRL
jgi:hypothetical protein